MDSPEPEPEFCEPEQSDQRIVLDYNPNELESENGDFKPGNLEFIKTEDSKNRMYDPNFQYKIVCQEWYGDFGTYYGNQDEIKIQGRQVSTDGGRRFGVTLIPKQTGPVRKYRVVSLLCHRGGRSCSRSCLISIGCMS